MKTSIITLVSHWNDIRLNLRLSHETKDALKSRENPMEAINKDIDMAILGGTPKYLSVWQSLKEYNYFGNGNCNFFDKVIIDSVEYHI